MEWKCVLVMTGNEVEKGGFYRQLRVANPMMSECGRERIDG